MLSPWIVRDLVLRLFAAGVLAVTSGCDPAPGPSPRSGHAGDGDRVMTLDGQQWVSLFNGRDLTGWEHLGGGCVRVEDGRLHLQTQPHQPGYLLALPLLCDFQARFRCKVVHGDSGLFFRSRRDPRSPASLVGPQVQLNLLAGRSLGGIYETQGRGWLCRTPAEVEARLRPSADWLEGELTVCGSRVRVVINGMQTVDWQDGDRTNGLVRAGHLAIQMHGGGCHVIWELLEVRGVP